MKNSVKEQVKMLRDKRQKIAFDANVQRVYQVDTPHAVRCLEEYIRLTELIANLEHPAQQKLPGM